MIIVCAALIAVDQILKVLVVNYLAPIGTAEVFPGFAGLRYVENDGMAFGMLSGMQPVLIIATAVVLAVVGYIIFWRRPKDRGILIGLMMIFSGGIGNLIDRIAQGYVVDYIEFHFVRFAVFNFADCCVSIGFVVLIIAYIRLEVKNMRQAKASKADALEAKTGEGADGAD